MHLIGLWGFVSGCALQSVYAPTQLHTQAAWSDSSLDTTTDALPITDKWWAALGDPALDTLMLVRAAHRQANAEAAQALANRDRAIKLKASGSMSEQDALQALTLGECVKKAASRSGGRGLGLVAFD